MSKVPRLPGPRGPSVIRDASRVMRYHLPAMKPFADRLVDAIKSKNSRVVVGLDPRLENLPPELQRGVRTDVERAAQAILDWGGEIIEAVRDHAVAVKP